MSSEKMSMAELPSEPAKLSTHQRLIGIFFSPGETFQDINRKPDWLLPVLLSIIVSIAGSMIIFKRVNPDWEKINRQSVDQRLERQGKTFADLPAQQQEAINSQIKTGAKVSPYIPIVISILNPAWIAFFALLFWGGSVIMGGFTSFKKVYSVTAYIFCAVMVCAQTTLSVTVAFLRNPEDIDFLKGGIAVTNPGMLMPSTASPALVSLLTRLDIFPIWFLILMTIGLSAVSRNLKTGSAATAVFGVWAIYVVATVIFSALLG